MPVTQTLTFSATPPTVGENPTTFNYNAIACWVDLKDNIVPDMNTAFGQMNTLETNVNAKEASAVAASASAQAAATAAAGSANYQGDWLSQGYTLGQSVSYNGSTYVCKLTHVTAQTPTNTTYWLPTGFKAVVNDATNKATLADNDLVGVLDSADSYNVKNTTWAQFVAMIKNIFSSAVTKAAPVAADSVIIIDSEASNAPKRLLWSYFTGLFAPLASPTFTGDPKAPTPSAGDNDTSIATTAFVQTAITGHVRQMQPFQTTALATGTATIPHDNTIPQITEGTQFLSLSITPQKSGSTLYIFVQLQTALSIVGYTTVALFDGSTDARATVSAYNTTTSMPRAITMLRAYTTSSTSPITFTVRAGGSAASTITINGENGAAMYGGNLVSSIVIMEVY